MVMGVTIKMVMIHNYSAGAVGIGRFPQATLIVLAKQQVEYFLSLS